MSSDPYTELLNRILANQESFAKELQAIKDKLNMAPAPVVVVAPAQTGGLYDYKRPDPLEPRYGQGIKMTEPNADEAKIRSMYAINYQGGQCRSTDEEACWQEIEKLQAGDKKTIARYDMMIPEFVGFGLLTNLFQPAVFQSLMVFEQTPWAGKTIQDFLNDQWAIMQSGGTPSGG